MQIQKHVVCRERRHKWSQKWNLQYSKVVSNSCALCIQQHRECQQEAFINIGLRVQRAPIMIGLSWEKAHTHKRLNPREITQILLLFHQLNTTTGTREFPWCILDKTGNTSNNAWNLIYNRFYQQVMAGREGEKKMPHKPTQESQWQCCSAT